MNNLNALIFFFQLVNLLGFTISAQSLVSENLVSAFKDKNDEVIGDVLKKMPGIDVTESGLITCNGIPINRFYIENMDMLQGRYGIAVKNIAVDDISIVQVLENHQPVKALEKIQLMDRAAINLKIKEGKKGIFGIFAMLGIGADTDLLWQEELTSTYFGKTRQHLFAYKTNNSSVDLSNELRSFTYDNSIDPLQLAYVQQPNPPAIPSDRYLFNNSHAAILNNLFKLKNDVEINANVAFYHNEDLRYGFSRTSYLLPGEERLIVSEDMSTQEITNRIEGEFRCNLNKERTYFNNYLNVASNRNNNRSDVNIPLPVEQQLNNQSFSIVVKYESVWATVQTPRLLVYSSIESTPRLFVTDKDKTTPTMTVGYFGFAKNKVTGKDELLLNYTITNPLVSISEQQVPLIGTLEMTRVVKNYMNSVLYEGSWFDVSTVVHTIVFKVGNFTQQLPNHGTSVAEPEY